MEFKQAVNIILKHEGGYVNDPLDPGGETRYGISKRAYPDLDIANLTKEDAKQIYKKDYWDACKCSELPESLRLMVFDCAVNQGVGFATKTLQSCVRADLDGIIGPKTLELVCLYNEDKILERYASKRLDAYKGNRLYFRFGKGWVRRLLQTTILTKK